MDAESPRNHWRTQLRLECKDIDARGRIVRIPGDNPDDIPHIAIVRFGDEYELALGEHVEGPWVERALAVEPRTYFDQREAIARALSVPESEISLERCRTYVFATSPSVPAGPAGCERKGSESYVAVVDGTEVAGASSSRSNAEAAELWVHTDPPHRRRGYARQVCLAWAAEVVATGKTAFYSHLLDNHASSALAASLGVTHRFDLVNVDIGVGSMRRGSDRDLPSVSGAGR